MLLTIGLLTLVGAVGLWGLVRWLEGQVVFHPTAVLVGSPADLGLTWEEVSLPTEDGETLHGWFCPGPAAAPVLCYFHGNAGNVSHRLPVLAELVRRGYAVLIIDYRGYGRSTGTPSEQGLYRDGAAAYRYLTETRGIAPARILLQGNSLGGAVAVHLASRVPTGGVILQSALSSGTDMARRMFPVLPAHWFLRYRFDSIGKIPRVSVPLLFIHGTDDTVVPMALGRRLFDAAPEPKTWLAIPGAGHNDLVAVGGATYWEAIDRFCRAASGAAPGKE